MAENKCDELFGKNGELVEFRKKQVLEGALEIVQRNYKETPNKMEVIAALFGKKLGEVFSVEFVTGSLKSNKNFASCCYFTTDGLFCEDRGPCETMLNDLLTGKAVIVDD